MVSIEELQVSTLGPSTIASPLAMYVEGRRTNEYYVGEEDRITPVAAASVMVEAMPGATLVVLPRAGHLTPLEDPAGVVEAILSWYPATHEEAHEK